MTIYFLSFFGIAGATVLAIGLRGWRGLVVAGTVLLFMFVALAGPSVFERVKSAGSRHGTPSIRVTHAVNPSPIPVATSSELDGHSNGVLEISPIPVKPEESNDVRNESAFLPLKLGMSHEEAVREVPLGAEFLLLTSSSQLSHARMARLPGGPEVTVVEDSAGVVIQIWSSDPTATIGNGVHPGLTCGELRQRYPSVEPMEYPGFGRIVELERNLRVKLHTSGEAVVDADTISSVVLYGRSY